MLGGVTHHMLPHPLGVPHPHVNRNLVSRIGLSASHSFKTEIKCRPQAFWFDSALTQFKTRARDGF